MTPEEQFDRVFASAMQDRQALRRFLDGVTAIQARWPPPGRRMVDPGGA